tara:strand:+ start:8459 stop:8887 length:429 start_codon:yes stop_codon:yes gene_type:complete
MGPKFSDLEAQNQEIQASGVADVIAMSNAPFDAFIAQTYSDYRAQIIKDRTEVVVGDKAYAGNVEGIVTAITDDGEVAPEDTIIEVTYRTPYMQSPNADSVENRVVEYNIIDNDDADSDGTNKVTAPNELSGDGVVFFRIIE